ncbi:hypothetical protein ACVWYN_000102 [Pedobacter sp. UYP24]
MSHENIVESVIDFNQTTIKVEEIRKADVFEPTATFKAYFSASAAFIDGKYVFVATESADDHDFSYADLQIKTFDMDFNLISAKERFLVNQAKLNSVVPSMIKVGNYYHFYYLRQESYSDARIYFMKSIDNGLTWTDEQRLSFVNGYNCIANDRVVILSSGRIIIPVAFTNDIDSNYDGQYVFCYYSDDQGKTWNKTQDIKSTTPLMEPSVAEFKKGQLLMVMRSKLGKLLFSKSYNNGINWTVIEKSKINTPVSTSALYRVDENKIALIWNNSPSYKHVFDRSPLSLSFSVDGGNSWSQPYEVDKNGSEIYSSQGLFYAGDNQWVLHYNYSPDAARYGIRAKLLRF